MTKPLILSIVLGSLMVFSAGLTKLITPTIFLAADQPMAKLETLIPSQFGTWKEEKNVLSVIVTAQRAELLEKIYTDVLSRTYISESGERIMLSIAYGVDQRDENKAHFPESCYPAQGFEIISNNKGVIATHKGVIPVRRIETRSAKRTEPVTYWAVIGDIIIDGQIEKKYQEMLFSLKNKIPDGLVFRVSSIDNEPMHAFNIQDSFVTSLVDALKSIDRKRLTGIQ